MRGRVREDGRRAGGDVGLGDRRDDAVPGGAGDDPVDGHLRQEVEVEGVAQDGEGHAGGAEGLLGGPVGAREGEHGVGRGAEERGVDDVRHAGSGGGGDERAVLVESVGALGGRDHEEHVEPGQGLSVGRVRVASGGAHPPGAARGAGGVPDDEDELVGPVLEQSCDHAADAAGGPRDPDARHGAPLPSSDDRTAATPTGPGRRPPA